MVMWWMSITAFINGMHKGGSMKFYVMGMQPSTEKVLSLSSKVFDNLQEALHYRDTVSPAWRPFVAVQITEEVQQGESNES